MVAALRGSSLTIEIPLTRGFVAIVDAEDFAIVAPYTWTYHADGYAKNAAVGLMHRLILNASDGVLVDHEDLDGLNNRRSNLRACTMSQNHANTRGRGAASGYKGVYFDPRRKRRPWRACIKANGRNRSIGSFARPGDAARAYDAAALEQYGEFARLNFPEGAS